MNSPTSPPIASAIIRGSTAYPNIKGTVMFRQTPRGVLISAEIFGLPISDSEHGGNFFGFHIHDGGTCTQNQTEPFPNTLGHYNPNACPHPFHAGDLPPLIGAGGIAVSVCLSDRFRLDDVVGRTIVIHSSPDDFTTQPAGNSGTKIACGVIQQKK